MSAEEAIPVQGLVHELQKNAGLTIASGVVLLIGGLFAVMSPLVAGLSITMMVGAILAVGGIGQCFLAFKTGALGKGMIVFAVGLLMTIVGLYMMQQPVTGLAKLTILLMAYLLVTGVMEIAVAFQFRPAQGWGTQLANGLITLLLGVLLWRQFPLSGAWAIGVLFGIKMIFSGWALIFIGRIAKKSSVQIDSA